MKCRLILALTAFLLLLRLPASAQVPFVLVGIDENGLGAIALSGNVVEILPSSMAPDPGPGGLSSVLTYDTGGAPLTPGDVGLFEGNDLTDVIRFNPDGTILFYSDNNDGFDSLADTPSPPTDFYANFVALDELGTEGFDGAFYTPDPGDPGSTFIPVTYVFVSDGSLAQIPFFAGVPEPGSMALLFGFGLTGAGLLRRRKR